MPAWIELVLLVLKTMMEIRADQRAGRVEDANRKMDAMHAAGDAWSKRDISSAADLLAGRLPIPKAAVDSGGRLSVDHK